MDMSPYLDVFIEESREHLNNLNQFLLKLESDPDNSDYINEIFRSCHTIKGMAGTMGFERISVITHEMENVLQKARNKEINIDSKLIDILFEFIDIIENLTESISKTGTEEEKNVSKVLEKLKKITVGADHSKIEKHNNFKTLKPNIFNEYEENLIKIAYDKNLFVYEVRVLLNGNCLLKSARAFVIFKNLEKLGEIIKTVPTVEDIEDESFEDEFTLYLITNAKAEELENIINCISEVKRTEVSIIDYKKKEVLFESQENSLKEEDNIKGDNKDSYRGTTKSISNKFKATKTVRVDIEKLDNLMNLVSELIIIKTRIEEIRDNRNIGVHELHEAVEYLERITTNLHDAVMKVRMVPIEQVFNRFPRLVRDLSKELDKDVVLHIEGEETELDRTVIDEIGDPLIHLIRNAIDHGIESPSERERYGKSKQGNIYLKAYHDGNHVVIELEDDGSGINIEKVLSKAAEQGLLIERRSDNQINTDTLNLLFNPGFSTTEKITDLSGRGVGLDVVKTKIESLGGMVNINTNKKKGTKFIVRLPLTLAIIQALLIGVSSEKYAIPLNVIKETIIINSNKINNVQKQEVTLYRGNVLPIVRLDKTLDCKKSITNSERDDITLVVVNNGEKQIGLVVDSLIGQQEIVIKSLGKLLSNIRIIAGATILGNGQVALILDTNTLL